MRFRPSSTRLTQPALGESPWEYLSSLIPLPLARLLLISCITCCKVLCLSIFKVYGFLHTVVWTSWMLEHPLKFRFTPHLSRPLLYGAQPPQKIEAACTLNRERTAAQKAHLACPLPSHGATAQPRSHCPATECPGRAQLSACLEAALDLSFSRRGQWSSRPSTFPPLVPRRNPAASGCRHRTHRCSRTRRARSRAPAP